MGIPKKRHFPPNDVGGRLGDVEPRSLRKEMTTAMIGDDDGSAQLDLARQRWGEYTLLRREHTGRWRPVFPQPRHKLNHDAYQRQLNAFVAWKSRARAHPAVAATAPVAVHQHQPKEGSPPDVRTAEATPVR